MKSKNTSNSNTNLESSLKAFSSLLGELIAKRMIRSRAKAGADDSGAIRGESAKSECAVANPSSNRSKLKKREPTE